MINKDYAPIFVRIGISLVFLWFGLNQIFDGGSFLGYVPSWVSSINVQASTLIVLHGIFETLFGLFLLLGIFTRLSATLLGLNLLNTIINLGYNEIAVRDFGLLLGLVSIIIHGADKLCLDKK